MARAYFPVLMLFGFVLVNALLIIGISALTSVIWASRCRTLNRWAVPGS